MIKYVGRQVAFAVTQSSDPLTGDADKLPCQCGWKLGAAFGLAVPVIAAGLAFGGEWGRVASSAWEVIPFAGLALLAYLGTQWLWAKVLALVGLAVILLTAAVAVVLFTFLVVLESASLAQFAQPAADPVQIRVSEPIKLALVSGGIGVAILIAGVCLFPGARRGVARVLPLDPRSFVHMVALVTVVALTLISFAPLLVLDTPPVPSLVAVLLAQGEDLTEGRGPEGMLLDELYGLVWLVPATVVAVGYGVRRNFKQALQRLGLQRPTWRQVAGGVGLAAALVLAAGVLSLCVDWIWDAMGWPRTDMKTFEQLVAHFFSPWGAVVIGVVAGLGEELAVRGVLQPRLGIWLSNLFFTGLHALQYNWDSLLIVFVVGLVLGLIRQKTNTTMSAIVHGTYDFLLLIVIQIPRLSE